MSGQGSDHGHVFFVGPRKTGTTALYDILRESGTAISPKVKESFFFDQLEPELAQYESLFGLDPGRPFIEVSPSYFTSDQASANIARLFPQARIVVTLRHPVRRALSALLHAGRIGLLRDADVERPTLNSKHVCHILDGSSYSRHLVRWSEFFPGRVLVLKQESTGTYSKESIAPLGQFIGVPLSASGLAARRVNQAREPRFVPAVRLARGCKRVLVGLQAFQLVRRLKILESLLFKRARSLVGSPAESFFTTHLAEEVRVFDAAPRAAVLRCAQAGACPWCSAVGSSPQ